MISFTCDKCERTLEAEDSAAGTKMECPDCGDTNIVPEPHRSDAQTGEAAAASARDAQLAKEGLPPATGPERRILRIHPSMFRAIPGLFVLLGVLVVGGIIGGAVFGIRAGGSAASAGSGAAAGGGGGTGGLVLMWLCFTLAALAAISLGVWWLKCKSVTLEITNKRTISNHGLLSKSTSEVRHDAIRNFQVRQSIFGRVLNVGSIGISSSGQDGVEITVDHVARPMHLRRVIDAYRDM